MCNALYFDHSPHRVPIYVHMLSQTSDTERSFSEGCVYSCVSSKRHVCSVGAARGPERGTRTGSRARGEMILTTLGTARILSDLTPHVLSPKQSSLLPLRTGACLTGPPLKYRPNKYIEPLLSCLKYRTATQRYRPRACLSSETMRTDCAPTVC